VSFLKPVQLRILAISEWLMVLPATIFLAAAAGRLLQPRQYEPARTSWLIFEWTTVHVSQAGAAIVFLALPALVSILGCWVLAGAWRKDPQFRGDVAQALTAVRRHVAIALLGTATTLALALVLVSVMHVITD
jgi:hypothetical protein